MRGIYKITNKINKKVYIGETLNIIRRWDEHLELLRNNKHHSYKLQKDWNEFGEDNFKFSVVAGLDDNIKQLVDRYVLLYYENMFIKKYDSINNGYNVEKTYYDVIDNGTNSDKKLLESVNKNIENGNIVLRNGIIYKIDDIKKPRDKVKKQKTNKKHKEINIDKNDFISLYENIEEFEGFKYQTELFSDGVHMNPKGVRDILIQKGILSEDGRKVLKNKSHIKIIKNFMNNGISIMYDYVAFINICKLITPYINEICKFKYWNEFYKDK